MRNEPPSSERAPSLDELLARPAGRLSARELLPVVYNDLRRVAAARLAQEPAGQTLQPTALVHDAYLRLVGKGQGDTLSWENRGHFFGAVALAMRRILIERARVRHPAERLSVTMTDFRADGDECAAAVVDVEALELALGKLATLDPRRHEVVMLRFFGGATMQTIGGILGISEITAKRDWLFARAWLLDQMQRNRVTEVPPP